MGAVRGYLVNQRGLAASTLVRTLLEHCPGLVIQDIADIATELEAPIGALTFASKEFIHVSVSVGLNITMVHRDHSFTCNTGLSGDFFEVENTRADQTLRANPYVTDGPKLRSFAGVPLVLADGIRIGSLCVADHRRHHFGEGARLELIRTAQAIVTKIEAFMAEQTLLGPLEPDVLLEMLRVEPRLNKVRLIMLSNLLYSRLDKSCPN